LGNVGWKLFDGGRGGHFSKGCSNVFVGSSLWAGPITCGKLKSQG
jgi:hypothetical protein